MKLVKKFLNIILISLVLVLAALFYSNLRTKTSEVHLSSLAKPQLNMDLKVNEYMQEMQRKRMSAELNSINRLQNGFDSTGLSKKGATETDPSSIPIERQIWKDSDKQVSEKETQMDVIYRRIYEEEVIKRLTEQEKKQYAMEFIENARQSGYLIRLSMDLEVISVEPIRNPQSDYDSLDIKN